MTGRGRLQRVNGNTLTAGRERVQRRPEDSYKPAAGVLGVNGNTPTIGRGRAPAADVLGTNWKTSTSRPRAYSASTTTLL